MELKYFLHLVTLFVLTPYIVASVTRCYDNLGCYDSGDLHALPQDPSHVRTQFRISCRNHTDDVIVVATSDSETKRKAVDNSCFQVDRPTKFIIHGFNDEANSDWVKDMRDLLLRKGDYNVIAVDWHHGAKFPYEQAVANSFMVAKEAANFIRHLEIVHGQSPVLFHLIGHSLGAQIAGNAGADLKPTRIARISGLDPAEPFFGLWNDQRRLDSSDAIFVDVIHTDGEKFTGFKGYGSMRPQGHIDIYPNGGEKQPGCTPPDAPGLIPKLEGIQEQIACNHARAIYLYMQSLQITSCSLSAHACKSWEEFESGNCFSCPSGGCVPLGIDADVTSGVKGALYLSTTHEMPFCGTNYLVNVTIASTQNHAYGRIFLTLSGNRTQSGTIDFSRSNRHYHAGEMEGHVITVPDDLGELTAVKVTFVKGSGLSALGTSDSLRIDKVSVMSSGGSERWVLCETNGPQITSPGIGVSSLGTHNPMTFQTDACP